MTNVKTLNYQNQNYNHTHTHYHNHNHYHYHNNYRGNKYKSHQCLNCGGHGHLARTCNHPVTSFGIICYIKDGDKIKYLMIQRKDSCCYIEFLRGKYKFDNINYLLKLFRNITPEEKKNISTLEFDVLWRKLWKDYDIKKFKREYTQSKNKFTKLKNGFLNDNSFINLDYLVSNSINNKNNYDDTEFEFPKGRRNLNENNIKCAIREFEEESGLSKNKIELINTKSYEEIYIAVNNVRYRHIYYIAKCMNNNLFNELNKLYNPLNKIQIKEVKDVKWLSSENVIKNIRDIYIERIELFKRIDKIVKKHEFIS